MPIGDEFKPRRRGEGFGGKTIQMQDRLIGNSYYEEPSGVSKHDNPHGKYRGRPIIASAYRDGIEEVPINGGVYLGGGQREAIVVDESIEKESLLIETYKQLIQRRGRKVDEGIDFKKGILGEVFELVKETLPYDLDGVLEIVREKGVENDGKISLSVFIQAKKGVCRHQALLVGYLLERLQRDGLVTGKVSVDRNYIPGVGGHAWVRYISGSGDVYIIDPAQDYFGKLDEVPAGDERRYIWDYRRAEEKKVNI